VQVKKGGQPSNKSIADSETKSKGKKRSQKNNVGWFGQKKGPICVVKTTCLYRMGAPEKEENCNWEATTPSPLPCRKGRRIREGGSGTEEKVVAAASLPDKPKGLPRLPGNVGDVKIHVGPRWPCLVYLSPNRPLRGNGGRLGKTKNPHTLEGGLRRDRTIYT